MFPSLEEVTNFCSRNLSHTIGTLSLQLFLRNPTTTGLLALCPVDSPEKGQVGSGDEYSLLRVVGMGSEAVSPG